MAPPFFCGKNMSGFVYVWHDTKKNLWYVGSHWGSPDDGYICSSGWMKAAYRKRPEDFRRRIVKTITTSYGDLMIEEHRWLQMIKPSEIRNRYYNLRLDASNRNWMSDPDRVKTAGQKISKALKGVLHSEERRRKTSEAGMGRVVTEDTRRKISESNIGRKNTPEFCARRAELNTLLNTGKARPQSFIDKMTGRKNTEETKQKMSESNKVAWTKRVNKTSMKGMLWWNNGTNNKRAETQPGTEWVRGQLIKRP